MRELLIKHQQSCDAAQNLIKVHKFYAASVHCSYYSCIQLIKYAFLSKWPGIDPAVFESELSDKTRGGTHNVLRRKMKDWLKDQGVPRKDVSQFDTTLKELKFTRVDADYSGLHINEFKGKEAQSRSVKVNSLIKATFSIV